MKGILAALWRYLVPFLLVTSMAAAAWAGDMASISAVLGLASLWYFSNAMRVTK
jgi:hypothetical protein